MLIDATGPTNDLRCDVGTDVLLPLECFDDDDQTIPSDLTGYTCIAKTADHEFDVVIEGSTITITIPHTLTASAAQVPYTIRLTDSNNYEVKALGGTFYIIEDPAR